MNFSVSSNPASASRKPDETYDLVILGATPAGIAAAIAAADRGFTVLLLERLAHIGGLPANGLGATDIATRGVAGGLFRQMTSRILQYYRKRYGFDSEQVVVSSQGFHFEPSVAEKVLLEMLEESPSITVRTRRQFDALESEIRMEHGKINAIHVTDLSTGQRETYAATAFIDATYEGDLSAAAGVPFITRREGQKESGEPGAGRVYRAWGASTYGEGSTGEGDDTIQAYNFRLCLTTVPENRVPIEKPASYRREEYASVAEDIKLNRFPGVYVAEREWDGIGRIVNIVWLPNGKTDANNQHLAFVSTDLPEENWQWPTADWAWRDAFQQRLREYTLGLLWFMQNDPAVPEPFRSNAARYGLAADEYQDNGNFPRQVYVREGRRIEALARFTAHDAIPTSPGARPPVHASSIGASHYPIDSHAIRKREENRDHLDGFISISTRPYTVPYEIMVPREVTNLWTPVAVSASHLGFGTLRMEPCWMCLGEAAGAAAAIAVLRGITAQKVSREELQKELIRRGAMLIYYRDVSAEDPAFAALQYLGVRGAFPDWDARLDDPMTSDDWAAWSPYSIAPVALPQRFGTRRDALIHWWAAQGSEEAISEEEVVSVG